MKNETNDISFNCIVIVRLEYIIQDFTYNILIVEEGTIILLLTYIPI